MSPERWQRIKSVYGEALERRGAEREAFLEEACGADCDLRAEVDTLLREKDGPGLESPIQAADWTGRELGPFHLVEKIGEGGMGAVWKARDAKLGRTVALKFVSAHNLSAEMQQRLLREAQASAALDHPNICHVYGIYEEQGETFIAMAFIDGPSLVDKIKDRPLPLEEALDNAIQIAEGLQEAHEKGIVHRDIKPHNVMLTARGQVKITDFGLASLADRSKITKTGTTLGTLAYMAPEQLEGGDVDRRADIWALGCVLYEMLAQHTPFQAEYEQAVAYGILNGAPEPVTALRAGLPIEVDRVIAKALAKDKEARYQHADDLLVDLKALSKAHRVRTPTPPVEPASPSRATPPRWIPAALAAAALIGAMTVWLAKPNAGETERAVIRFDVPPPEGAFIRSFELSPDGRHLAFVAQHEDTARLWLRSFDEPAARPIERADGVDPLSAPFWSPDSRMIGFFAARKLKKVGILGEPPVEVADANAGRGGAWNEHGDIVFQSEGGTAHELTATTADGGEPRPATPPPDEQFRGLTRWPYFLPGGERFIYSSRLGPPGADLKIRLGYLDSLESKVLTTRKSHAAPVAFHHGLGSYLLLVESGVLMAYPFDASSGILSSDGIPVARDVGNDRLMARAMFSASATGALAHSSRTFGVDAPPHKLLWLNRQGERGDVVLSGNYYNSLRIAPDQTRAALWIFDDGGGPEKLIIVNLQSGSQFRPAPSLTGGTAGWSRDGTQLIHGNLEAMYRISADASFEPEEIVVPRPADVYATDWSRDGRWLLLADYSQGYDKWDLLRLRLPGGEPEPYLVSPYDVRDGRFSPDGRFVA